MWNTLCGLFGKVMEWIYHFAPNYGLAIILFTIVLKILLFPFSLKQQKSSMAMVRMKPLQDELQKKYGSNRQKYSEELQKLYEREGYNPMGSCLPTLLQMPVIFIMYTIIRRPLTFMAGWNLTKIWTTAVAKFGTTVVDGKTILAGMDKLKITAENFNRYESQILSKLGSASPLNTKFLGLELSVVPSETWKTVFWILLIPVLSGATSFLLSWLSQKMNPAQQAAGDQGGNMKLMLYLMPIMSLWIAYTVPAGLGLYWIISNILGIGQLFLLNKIYDPKKVEKEMEEKLLAQKQKEKEKRAEAAAKKAAAVQGKKKKKKAPVQVNNGEGKND